jgi:hypothetical protein
MSRHWIISANDVRADAAASSSGCGSTTAATSDLVVQDLLSLSPK